MTEVTHLNPNDEPVPECGYITVNDMLGFIRDAAARTKDIPDHGLSIAGLVEPSTEPTNEAEATILTFPTGK